MALPPKSDDDTPSSARADSEASDKKTRRPRTRARAAKPAEEKPATKPAKGRARRGAVAKTAQTEFPAVTETRELRNEPVEPPPAREERASREEASSARERENQ